MHGSGRRSRCGARPLERGIEECIDGLVLARGIAVQAALDSGRPSAEHVLNVLSRLKAPTTSTNLATTKLQLTEEPAADVSRYETLRANPPEDRHV
ncbi:hypothetical protein [Burkholderia glumae]|uniref:hypothetical protein n=1 Tax=Burkholderia glumae TaxID=337 RepID=UPI003B97B9DA